MKISVLMGILVLEFYEYMNIYKLLNIKIRFLLFIQNNWLNIYII